MRHLDRSTILAPASVTHTQKFLALLPTLLSMSSNVNFSFFLTVQRLENCTAVGASCMLDH
jgi:hypothetical protein